MTQVDCIAAIEAGARFVVLGPDGTSVPVRVHTHVSAWNPEGAKYIATDADATTANNLLSLPDCPWDPLDRWFPYQ